MTNKSYDCSWHGRCKTSRRMKTLTIKITSLSLLLIGALALSGCNTTEGVGEDMEQAGEAVQDAAK